jgi:hypothetical protein
MGGRASPHSRIPGGIVNGAGSHSEQRDTNHDGKLTRDELPAGLFDKFDADKNGFVSETAMTALGKR